ncbi:ATP-binding protein [Curtobacterium luteum]|uniref:ATP-binding protein n=1 Tax=Curtobacterium luteum TaxID=33881 RepID=UPI0037FECD37
MTTATGAHRVELDCPPDDVTAVHEFLARVWQAEPSVSAEDRMALELALVELASNVIEHAARDRGVACQVDLACSAEGYAAVVTDDGAPASVDPGAAALPEDLAESGRGLALVQMVVDELRYDRVGDRNRWSLHRARHD